MEKKFCTVINCIDGRIQIPVIEYLQQRFNALYVDSITVPAPNLILAEQKDKLVIEQIMDRISISIDIHNSVGMSIVAHHDCARNPSPRVQQLIHLEKSLNFLTSRFELPVIALWVDENWQVHEINFN
ncbi:MAG: hypothetical protein D6748_06965 [Calditrichaeota bacterium]|nr:MAG: hypothetical protein D6748_06965 [Calditrichota bacterium]